MNKCSDNVELFFVFPREATRYEFGFKFKCSIRLNHGTKLLLLLATCMVKVFTAFCIALTVLYKK